MSKRKANDGSHSTALSDTKKKKCSLNFKPEWLRESVETELPTSSRKQVTKLGDIFTYRETSDEVICTICQEARASGAFTTGKRWDDWKIDYLKRHINQKIHLDSVSKLRCQKSGGLQRLLTENA